eukprot:798524-Prymnesium_polylepis.1
MEAGVDSLGAVELRNLIQDTLGDGVSVPSTLLLDYPTARRLAKFLGTTAPARGRVAPAAPAISVDDVIDMVSSVAGGSVDDDAPLMEAGVDSLGA